MQKFCLPLHKIQALWVIFCQHDRSVSGYIMRDEFFNRVLRYKPTVLTHHLFKLIESKSDDGLSFGEFVELITTFCCFEKHDLLRFFFYILDGNKCGLIGKTEIKHFVSNMWENQLLTNVTDGLDCLDAIDDGDGAFNFSQLEHMQERYPIVLYPLYRLQTCFIQNTLGEYFWENHKASIIDLRTESLMEEEKRLQLRHKAEAKSKELVTDDMLKQRMGYKYYLFPWQRGMEKTRMMRIAALDDELG